MGVEIERKFLVNGTDWKIEAKGLFYQQGYLNSDPERTVRIRRAEDKGYITIKGKSAGASRLEYEYEIALHDALELLNHLCEKPIIEKTRYRIEYDGLVWEVDEFHGENAGLVVAEVELLDEQQEVTLPPWVGLEVTTDAKYYNSNLFKYPFSQWGPSPA